MAYAATDEAAAKAHAELALYHQASVNRAEGSAPVVVPIGGHENTETRPTLGVAWTAPAGDK